MSQMKAAISCAFKHCEVPKRHIGQKVHGNKIEGPNELGSNLM